MTIIIGRIKGEGMNAKLTLKLDKGVIERAKLYSKTRHTSLSAMVEKYFIFLLDEKKDIDTEISPIIQELSGIIELPESFDLKEEYTKYLIEKFT